MGKIVELQTRPDRLRRDQESALREALLPFEDDDMPGGIVRELLTVIDRRSASRNKWTFVMLSPDQNVAVIEFIAKVSDRPILALRVWGLCFKHLRNDTGEIMLSRNEMAELVDTHPDHITRVMRELAGFGAVTMRYQKVKGLRGPGVVRYFMNPRVATHLGGAERDKAQDEAPPLLRLIEGSLS